MEMPQEQLKSNIHRFRVRKNSTTTIASHRRRSASPARVASISDPSQAPARRSNSTNELPDPPKTVSNSLTGAHRNVPSCDRCRTFKKKCSRTFPTCSLCASAGRTCSLSTRATSDAAQTHHLQARIEWLSKLVNKELSLPIEKSIETIDTGTDVSLWSNPGLQNSSFVQGLNPDAVLSLANDEIPLTAKAGEGKGDGLVGSTGSDILESNDQSKQPSELSESVARHRQSLAVILASESPSSDIGGKSYPYLEQERIGQTDVLTGAQTAISSLTPEVFARQCVDAYFRHVNRAYPFINKAKIYLDLQVVNDWSILKTPKNASSTLLHLVMAIGCTTLQRAGKLPKGSSSVFEIAYASIVQECISRDDEDSLQTLVLVALYSLFDPNGMSAWTIAGIASRQAILCGLSRKASEKEFVSTAEIEPRSRLFWSIWVLDRMMAFSLGLPVALTDESHDVPLPGLTIEEFASMERQYYASMLQTNRHIIQLRQLEDKILQQVLQRKGSDVATMSQVDCRSLIQTIRADVENWYSNGCLVSPLDADSVPIHSSITWLSSRYYHLLLFLHYPCPLNSKGVGMSAKELLPLIQKCLQLTSVLLQQRQLPLNRVTLYRLFPVGLLLIHCLSQNDAAQTPFSARDDIGIIVNVLEAFPEEWTETRHAAKIFRQALDVISLTGVMGDRFYPSTIQQTPPLYGNSYAAVRGAQTESHTSLLRSNISSLTNLMQEVLGKASCFIFHELSITDTMAQWGPSSTQSMAPSMLGSTMPAVSTVNGPISESSPDGNNWELLDLAFF